MTYKIRPFTSDDGPDCAALFYAAIHQGTGAYYTAAEQQAWCPEMPDADAFSQRLLKAHCLVASGEDRIAGFMTLDNKGYIDLAFCHPEHIGKGAGGLLLAAIDFIARAEQLPGLSTDASLAAEGFFLHHGFCVIRRNEILRGSEILRNARMEKAL